MKTGALYKTSEREKGRDLCLYLRRAVECGKPPVFPRFRSKVWKQAVKMLGSLLPVTVGEVSEGAPQPQALALASP